MTSVPPNKNVTLKIHLTFLWCNFISDPTETHSGAEYSLVFRNRERIIL